MMLKPIVYPQPFPESWASGWGQDEYGLWTAFSYKGVRQQFRWIDSGVFMMGSPRDEDGRFSNETQHQVRLSQGFWLADCTVTQALWQAVMGDNPSRFKGLDRPVENVSWEMAQDFINQLNMLNPELRLCLPSEAQWEYACRAKTQTPFNFAEPLSIALINYRGVWDAAGWGEGALQETAAVKSYSPNAWGLYEMHGNVWEWCQDWYGEYAAGSAEDPLGPESGSYRVLRGGSWRNRGRSCRSAIRHHYSPGFASGIIGFRLARGHQHS